MAQPPRRLRLILLTLLLAFSLLPGLAAPPANLLSIRQRQVEALQELANGQLPDQATIEQLFLIDVLDEGAVAARRTELRAAIATAASASDSLSEQARLDVAADRARLAFLDRSLATRRRLLTAESLLDEIARLQEAIAEETDAAKGARQAAVSDIGSQPETAIAVRTEQAEARLRATARWQADLTAMRARVLAALQDQSQADRAAGHDVLASRVFEDLQRKWQRQAQALRRTLAREPVPADGGFAGDPALAEAVRRQALAVDVFGSEAAYAAAIRLLDGLPAGYRARVNGFGPVGWRAMALELERLSLAARWYLPWRWQAIVKGVETWRRPGNLVVALSPWLAALGILVAAVVVGRQGRRWLGRSRAVWRATAGSVWGGAPALAAYWPAIVSLVTIAILPGVLGHDAVLPEVALALRVAVVGAWAGIWAVTVRLVDEGLHRRGLPAEVAGKAHRSLTAIGRWFFGALLALGICRQIAGPGVLYHHLLQIAVLAGLGLMLRLARIWRTDVTDLYLALEPTGPWPAAVRRAQATWYGFAVSLAALLWHLLAVVGWHAGRLLLGIPQVRRLLAFAFRQQLSRRPALTAAGLPEDVKAALLTSEVVGTARQVGHFPDLDRLAGWLEANADRGGAWVISGEAGIGKSTWLVAAGRRLSSRRQHVWQPTTRLTRGDDLVAALAEAFGGSAATVAEVATLIVESGLRLMLVDDAHRLFLRTNDGFGAWEALDELIGRTRHTVAWFVAVRAEPYRYLEWYGRGGGAWDEVVRLPGWSDGAILRLIRTRTAAAGIRVRYDALTGEGIERLEPLRRFLGTDEAYARMLWEYGDGCPAVVLRAWVDSLYVADGRITAGGLTGPGSEALDGMEEVARFVLAAVVWHGGISLADAERSLRLNGRLCRDAVARLVDQGILVAEAGTYRVRVPWLRAVLRYLRRQHLIA